MHNSTFVERSFEVLFQTQLSKNFTLPKEWINVNVTQKGGGGVVIILKWPAKYSYFAFVGRGATQYYSM